MYKSSNDNNNRTNSKNFPNYNPMLERACRTVFDVDKIRMSDPKSINDTGYNAKVTTTAGNVYYVVGIHHKKWDEFDTFGLWQNKEKVIQEWVHELDNYVLVVYDPADPENKASVLSVPEVISGILSGNFEQGSWSDGDRVKTYYKVPFSKS